MPEKISIRIDGELVAGREGKTILDAARAGRQSSPALLTGRTSRRRRLPPLHRRGLRGSGPAAPGLHHAGAGRHDASPPIRRS